MSTNNVCITIKDEDLKKYFHRTHKSIHKLLYLFEEKDSNLLNNINDLILELVSGDDLLWNNSYFTQLIFNIQTLKYKIDNYKDFRSQIFKCINICDNIVNNLKGGV